MTWENYTDNVWQRFLKLYTKIIKEKEIKTSSVLLNLLTHFQNIYPHQEQRTPYNSLSQATKF